MAQRTKNIQGQCEHCRQPFSFPAESIGLSATCPHCGQETELMLATPEFEPALPRKALILGLVALLILVLGLLGSLAALKRARNMVHDQKGPRPVTTNTTAPSSR